MKRHFTVVFLIKLEKINFAVLKMIQLETIVFLNHHVLIRAEKLGHVRIILKCAQNGPPKVVVILYMIVIHS